MRTRAHFCIYTYKIGKQVHKIHYIIDTKYGQGDK